ncbi:hypothetical protein GF352_00455 [archaeon]|nr:hypothetical protein [archaeon]
MIKYLPAPGIKSRINSIVSSLGWHYIKTDQVFVFKTLKSKAKYTKARCWGMPRLLQQAWGFKPSYIIEVLGDYFEGLCDEHQDKLLIHELLHIPRTFSGALKPHRGSARKAQVTNAVINECYERLVSGQKVKKRYSRSINSSVSYLPAPSVKLRIKQIVQSLGWSHINLNCVACFKSTGTKSDRLHARIHPFPRIWQQAMNVSPRYVIELLSEQFNELGRAERDRLLIQELLYIPKTFSGALRPHSGYVSTSIVNKHYDKLQRTGV